MSGWKDEIRAIIENECTSWNIGDAAAYSADVSEDCVFTNIFGQMFEGKSAFQERHAQIFEGIFKGSQLKQAIEHLRLLHPEVAVADTSTSLIVPPSTSSPVKAVNTKLNQVFIRTKSGWKITSYHNVEVK